MRHHFDRMHGHHHTSGHCSHHGKHHRGMRAMMAMKLMGMMGGRGGGFWSQGGGGFDGDGDGFDGENLRRGRKFSAEDLQLLLLSLLDEKPSHGYELIKALETRTGGFYKPSPGVVYPALTFLEDVGYATVDLEGNKKRYQLSEAGRAYLDQNRARLEQMVARLQHVARKMDFMRRAMSGQPQRDVDEGGWAAELVQARGRLKQALMMRSGATADEQRRIAAILERAADEIEHGANQPE
jgi:DNA-binding PadR family transcriptional regulator